MNRWHIRKRLRERFFDLNPDLCKRAFAAVRPGSIYPAWKTEHGRELVQKIRRTIGYAKTTDNGQIFWTAYMQWKDIASPDPAVHSYNTKNSQYVETICQRQEDQP